MSKGLKGYCRTRRDLLFVLGRHGQKLDMNGAAYAWDEFMRELEKMGDMDVPKFKHLVWAIRRAHIHGYQTARCREVAMEREPDYSI